jgi:hypothetical protein
MNIIIIIIDKNNPIKYIVSTEDVLFEFDINFGEDLIVLNLIIVLNAIIVY